MKKISPSHPPLQWRLLTFSTVLFLSTSPSQSIDLKVFHIYTTPLNKLSSSWADTLLQMQSKDQARLQYLTNLVAGKSEAPVGSGRQLLPGSSAYIVKGEFGSPTPQPLLMALDNSNDVAFIPCFRCEGCSSSTVYDANKSLTSFVIPCEDNSRCSKVLNPTCTGASGELCRFNFTYGSSFINARLAMDTLKLGKQAIPQYLFGCIEKTTGASTPQQGLLGLGRGPLSLLAQTQTLYNSTFSYCLPSFKSTNFSGFLKLGTSGQPKSIKTTPLLKNPKRPSLYYVNLIGIKVGSKALVISPSAFAFNSTNGAGAIFDSGTSFTTLVKPAYVALRDEFRRRMGGATVFSLGGFDTCYSVPINNIPSITFLFDGMQVTLPPENFLIRSSAGTTSCLAMAAAPDNVNSVLNVIASMQQQNHQIFFDVPNSRLGVSRRFCS